MYTLLILSAVFLTSQQNYFSRDANSDKLTALQMEIENSKMIVTENIEKLIERGEHIDLLVERTAQLSVFLRHSCSFFFSDLLTSPPPTYDCTSFFVSISGI